MENLIEMAEKCYRENGIGSYDENDYMVFDPNDGLNGECIPIDHFLLELKHDTSGYFSEKSGIGYFAKWVNDNEIREYCVAIPDADWIKRNRMDFDYIAWYNKQEEE